MKRNIEQLYNTLKTDNVTFPTDVKDANSFEKKYFSSKKDADNFWEWLHKTKFQNGPGKNKVVYFPRDKKRFYEVYACDLTWAKNLPACKTSTDNTQTGNLPSWVPNCIKNDSTYKNVKPGRVNTEVVYDGTNGREYFKEDNKYRFRKKDGSKVDGTYECVDNKLYINTVLGDGQIYWEGEWKTLIEDKDLLEKINASSSFAQIVKIKFINLLDVSKAWTFKKIEELKKWWKNYKKNRDNDTDNDNNTDSDNVETNGIYTTKGDPYQYKVVDCIWYTKSWKNRGKIIKDWLSLEDNEKANNILDDRFPNARKECKKTDNTQTIITPPKPEPPKIILPDWAKCIGDSIVGVNVTKDENNLDIVFSPFGKSKGYFWNDGAFMFVYENGNKVAGKWSCDNNKLLIRTEDGDQWTPSTQWITQPSKYINPSVNNLTTDVAVTDLVDDESTPTETTKSDKPDSTEVKTPPSPPAEPVVKPDVSDEKSDLIDKYGPKNESYNSLEDVLNNINSFINEIEMKEIIREQKQQQSVVNAPAEELDILYGNAVLKTMGPVVTLCESGPTPIPVNVEGRMYFAGRKNKLKPGFSATEGYFVYDGRVLARTQGCNFVYVKNKKNEIAEISGMERAGLELPFKQLLSRFGVDNADYNSNPYYFIDTITKKFNNWIDKGARSSVFRSWQELLINYYKYDNTKRLKLTTDNQNNPPQDELSQYYPVSADKLGIQFDARQIQIFAKKGGSLTNQFQATTFNTGDCRQDLVSYVNGAYDYQQTGTDNPNVNNSAVRENIRNCFRAGMYKDVKLTKNDITVQFRKEDSPFRSFVNGGCGDNISMGDIEKALMGNGCKLQRVGPNGANKYLPFRMDATKGMKESTSKITNLIKENLTKLKREKDSSLLIETKIVKSRTELLTENRILKFKQPREKFFNEIISEAMYLNKQGFDKQIIKEEFWDSLKGLFGEHGSNAIFTTFKEYMGKYLVGKLTSINPNGWMGENIKEAINKIHIEDLDKITDCNFISRKISTSITDSIISKVSKGQDIEGGNISSIVKGGLDKSIDRTELTKNIHEGITKLICPVLGDVSKKLKEKGEEMKLKAVKP